LGITTVLDGGTAVGYQELSLNDGVPIHVDESNTSGVDGSEETFQHLPLASTLFSSALVVFGVQHTDSAGQNDTTYCAQIGCRKTGPEIVT
jgi:hypothetical protein